VNFYKPWSNMKILMLFHDFDVIGLLFHDFDVIGIIYIPWILRINLFKPTNPKDESFVRSMVYMVCNRNYMIDRSKTSKSWNNRSYDVKIME
jgi:hypothetical protein